MLYRCIYVIFYIIFFYQIRFIPINGLTLLLDNNNFTTVEDTLWADKNKCTYLQIFLEPKCKLNHMAADSVKRYF